MVVDINLGSGAPFKLAEALRDKRIPFVFVTSYDQQVSPEAFSDVGRLEEHVQLRRVVSVVAGPLHPAIWQTFQAAEGSAPVFPQPISRSFHGVSRPPARGAPSTASARRSSIGSADG